MWNIAIVDSDARFAARLKEQVESFYTKHNFDTNIQVYTRGSQAKEMCDFPWNLLFINTRLSDMNGYVLTESLLANQRRIPDKKRIRVIFLSDYNTDVFSAFRHQPFRYIRKKNWQKELAEALSSLWKAEHEGHCLLLRQNRRIKAIPIDEILYLESVGHYVEVHCSDQIHQTRDKLSHFEEQLTNLYFLHPTKSFLVNSASIASFDNALHLKNGEIISCSKTRFRETIDLYEKYIREMAQ